MGQQEHSLTAGENEHGAATLEDGLPVPQETEHILPAPPPTTLLGMQPKELGTYMRTKTWTRILKVALFVIAKS